jgi:hypothetical protein
MVHHPCEKCGKVFNKKSNYLKHIINKKKPCDANNANNANIDVNNGLELQKPFTAEVQLQKPAILEQNFTNILDDVKQEFLDLKMNKDLICNYCDQTFTRKDNLTKHINERCKIKKKTDEFEVLKVMLANILEERGLLSKVLEENKNIMNKVLDENKEFKKEIERLKVELNTGIDIIDEQEIQLAQPNQQTQPNQTNQTNQTNTMNNSHNLTKTTHNNSHNTTNNTVNNTVTNSNNNIVVQFGKEDLSKLDIMESMSIYLRSTGGNIIPNMLKYINFNPKHPENFNIYMSDLAREIVRIHDGDKFISKRFKSVKEQIINNVSSHITDICGKYVNDSKIKKSTDILKKINVNNISLKLINGEDIDELIREKDRINNKKLITGITNKHSNFNDKVHIEEVEVEEDLTPYQLQQIEYYEKKRQGLQDITSDKLRDELYNNRNLFV